MPLRYITLGVVVLAFVTAAVAVRIAHTVIHRLLDALDVVGPENRAVLHARGQRLIRALTFLARQDGERYHLARDMAETLGIPAPFLGKVLQPLVTRGIGSGPPPGGYQPADLIFFGVDDGPNGHVALWLGNGMIVQCSSSGDGSNIRPLAGYVAPTAWLRWALLTG